MIIDKAINLGACEKITKATDIRSLAWLFFSPQGREFCIEHNFPSLKDFKALKGCENYNVFVNKKVKKLNTDVALIHSRGDLVFNKVDRVYKVILMHGSKANIYIENGAVVTVEGQGANIYEQQNR